MRSNKTISLLLALLVMSSSFVTLCPAEHSGSKDVHLIAATCKSHDCHRAENSDHCDEEFCDHQTCNDKHLFEDINIQIATKTSIHIAPIPLNDAKKIFKALDCVSLAGNLNRNPQYSSIDILTTILRI